MKVLTALFVLSLISYSTVVYGQSKLLENVRSNQAEAKALCKKFEALNKQGIKSSSKEVINEISQNKNLTPTDAEILSIYVIAMYCPQIK